MRRNRILTAVALTLVPALFIQGCGLMGYLKAFRTSTELMDEVAEKATEVVSPDIPSDYSDPDNWLHVPEEATQPVDTFYVYPTIVTDPSEGAPSIVPIDSLVMRIGAYDTYEKNATAFAESTNVYAPFYRQSNLAAVATLRGKELEDFHRQEQLLDITAALDYYFEHYNDGRPFILAAHSQGSILLKLVVEDYMKEHPEYYERMIAAYLVGFSITEQDLADFPHLKFAEGADDTGVLISWNTEGPGNTDADNIVVEPGALVINPISWTRDETYVPASESLGSRVDDMAGALEDEIVRAQFDLRRLSYTNATLADIVTRVIKDSFIEEHPGVADAKLDLSRGVVICTNTDVPYMKMTNPEVPDVFGPASFHGSDYALYYYDVQENVKTRIDAWFAEGR